MGDRPDRTRPISGTGPVPGATSHANGLDFPLPGQGIYRRTQFPLTVAVVKPQTTGRAWQPVGSSFPSQRPFCLLGERGHDGRTTTEPPRVGPTGATPTPNRTAPLPLRTGPYADRFLSWPPVMFRDGGVGSVHPDIPANHVCHFTPTDASSRGCLPELEGLGQASHLGSHLELRGRGAPQTRNTNSYASTSWLPFQVWLTGTRCTVSVGEADAATRWPGPPPASTGRPPCAPPATGGHSLRRAPSRSGRPGPVRA